MGVGESLGYLNDLASALIRAEIDGCPNGGSAHVGRLLDCAEHDLVELVGVGQQLVVIHFHKERDFVGVFASHGTQNAIGGSDRIAATFNSETDNVFGVEIIRVFGKTCAGRMFDSLVHREI